MKMIPVLETMALFGDTGSCHDFPRLARESGFTFNLYRGRVDWKNIETVDVDRLIRERDLETLQGVLSSVISCSLDSEYDLKVLDPNFVKLFRLAQLAVDYLQYCRRYLDHCIMVMQEQLRVALQEVEQLQKDKKRKDEELHQMLKKMKTQSKARTTSLGEGCKCPICGKIFVSEEFLKAHKARRHSQFVQRASDSHQQEIQSLQRQIAQLQERLIYSEDMLRPNQSTASPDITVLKNALQLEFQKLKQPTNLLQDPSLNPKGTQSHDQEQGNLQTQNQPLIKLLPEEGAQSFLQVPTPTPHVKSHVEAPCDHSGLVERIQQQSDEIHALRDQLLQQHLVQEQLWQQKMEKIQRSHHENLEALRSSLPFASVGLDEDVSKHQENLHNTHNVQLDSSYHRYQAWSADVGSSKIKQQPEKLPHGISQYRPQEQSQQQPEHPLQEQSQLLFQQQLSQSALLQPMQKPVQQAPQYPPQQHLQQQPQQKPTQPIQQPIQQHIQQPILKQSTNQQQSEQDLVQPYRQSYQDHQQSKVSPHRQLPQHYSLQQKSQFSKAPNTLKLKSNVQSFKSSVGAQPRAFKGEIPHSLTPVHDREISSSPSEISSTSTVSSESNQSAEGNQALNVSEMDWDSSGKTQRKTSTAKNSMYEQATESSESESEAHSSSYTPTVVSDTEVQSHSLENTAEDSPRVALSPQVLAGLKEDLQLLLERRLRELGVDPEWEGLPAVTFRNNMAILEHQQNISSKSIKAYFQIRDDISREVESRIKNSGKKLQPTENSPSTSAHKGSEKRSKSLLARLKSSVKSKLYSQSQSSQSSVNTVSSDQSSKGSKKGIRMFENSSFRKDEAKESIHKQETLSDKPTSKDESGSNYSHEKSKETRRDKSITMLDVLNPQPRSPVPLKTNNSKMNEMPRPQVRSTSKSERMYGENSASVNPERSVVEIESQEQSAEIGTSTPITAKESLMKNDMAESGHKTESINPSDSASDIDSGSELESDLNDILENTQNISSSLPKAHPRTLRTTAELLADVARFRQNNAHFPALSSAVKSNLKSSSSTGNIKKKVVFQDEQDGFNSIELGPAHGPSSLPLPQRSQSASSLAMSSSSTYSSQPPVPQPRSNTVTALQTTDTNTDSDWDKDSVDVPIQRKPSAEKETVVSNDQSGRQDWMSDARGKSEQMKWNTGSANSKAVVDIAKDIERQLQQRQGKPFHGIDTAGLVESKKPSVLSINPKPKPEDQENNINLSNLTLPSSSGLDKMYSTVGDSLELLLDDFSSS